MRNVIQIFSLYNGKSFTASLFITFIACVCCQHTFAQVTDNFADGNYTADPIWTGSGEKFAVYNQQLRLQAPAVSGNAYLVTPSRVLRRATWEFFLNLQFNPSSENYVRVYLASDQPDLTGALNGYFVMVGNTADEVSLYRQSGTQRTKIIAGIPGRLNLSSVMVRVKITRDDAGVWQLFSDVGETGAYAPEGNVVDNTFSVSAYFGVMCVYTATRADKIYFDDFVVREEPLADTQKPELESVKVLSARELALQFSEPLHAGSVAQGAYIVDRGLGNALRAQLQGDQKTVRLEFAADFPNGATCTLAVSGVADLAGNVMEPGAMPFMHFVPEPVSVKDVIVTEVLPDPTPQIGLPDGEFAEIHNRSGNVVNLVGWTLTDGASTAKFPAAMLAPGEYLILTASANAAAYGAVGRALVLPNFPTLNNTGDVLVLKDSSGVTIDSLTYSAAWYHDDDKKEGGWSLELIDPANTCAAAGNWTASEDERGGTPGAQNSVFANKPDVAGPVLKWAMPVAADKVRLMFDEKLDRVVPAEDRFRINPEIEVQGVRFTDASLTTIELTLAAALAHGTGYTLFVERIYDCAGNGIETVKASVKFGLPETADSADVVINEILFNPRPTGLDFVEVCNRSAKYLNLKNWRLANGTTETSGKVITPNDLLLAPGGYLLFSEDGEVVKSEYPLAQGDNFLDVKDVPSMSDDEGSMVLLDSTGRVMDAFAYSNDMHSPFIDDDEGVSLERLSWTEPTQLAENWHSAGTQAGYATPGYKNSTAVELLPSAQVVMVEPEAFMPEAGQPSFTRIHYQFDKPGLVANVNIIDPQGRAIKSIAANEILGTSGFYRWDGDMDDGRKARIGYYMVWFEVFDNAGNVQVFKKRVALVGDF